MPPKATNRIGLTKTMKNGQQATIINYIDNSNITIKFEDDSIVEKQYWTTFQKGTIENPNKPIGNIDVNKINQRLHEKKMMNCGMIAEIIDYKKSNDITIRFEDETIISHCCYRTFSIGQIKNPNYNKYKEKFIGMTNVMKNGQQAKIVDYIDMDDITIEFEDGTIIEHKKLDCFKKGYIKNVNKRTITTNRLHEKKMMNCGMIAEIIEYECSKNITIRFEDGTVISNCCYETFNRGQIKNPNYDHYKEKYIGMTNTMANGQQAKIIDYIKGSDVTIQFEDNTIVYHKLASNFLKGEIKNPNFTTQYNKNSNLPMQYKKRQKATKSDRVGEYNKNHQGFDMKIIDYKCYDDIEIQFEDGIIVKGSRYAAFKKGSIPHPKYPNAISTSYNELVLSYYLSPFGFNKSKPKSKNGIKNYELDLFNENCNGHKIAIEYDGYLHTIEKDTRKNKLCKNANITLFRIRENMLLDIPNSTSIDYKIKDTKHFSNDLIETLKIIVNEINKTCQTNYKLKFTNKDKDKVDELYAMLFLCHKGEKTKNNVGLDMEVLNYRGILDIDVFFPKSGSIVKHKIYKNFKKGKIKDPNELQYLVGTQYINKFGEKYEITKIVNKKDVDVLFIKTNQIKCHQSLNRAINGIIVRDDYYKEKVIGQTITTNQGLKATLINYENANNITMQFEDGTTLSNIKIGNFKTGGVLKPQYIMPKHIGETNIHKSTNELMEIIEWNSTTNVTIRFPDGVVRKNVSYNNFRQGKVAKIKGSKPSYNQRVVNGNI